MIFEAGVGISVLLGSVQSRSDHWIKLILGFVGGGKGSGTVKRSVLVRLMFRWYLCSLSCDVFSCCSKRAWAVVMYEQSSASNENCMTSPKPNPGAKL